MDTKWPACAFVALLLCAGAFGADSIGIRFQGTAPAAMATSETAGVFARTNWNNETGATQATPQALIDNTGGSSGATVTWASSNSTQTGITDTPGNLRMMKGYLDPITGNATVTVTGLPTAFTSGGYHVLIYTDGDLTTGRTGFFSIAGTQINATDTANFNGTFVRAFNTAGNYVQFSNLTSDTFTLTAMPGTPNDGNARAPVNAIQIVAASVAPESTWTGLGADSNFSTAGNWAGDAVPAGGSTWTLVFPTLQAGAQANAVNDLPDGTAFGAIVIAGNGSGSGYTISGNVINLNGGLQNISAAAATIFNAGLKLTANTTISTDAGLSLSIGGAIDTNALAVTASATGTGTITFSASSNINGTGALATSGTGTINFGGTVAPTGTITIASTTTTLGGTFNSTGAIAVTSTGTTTLSGAFVSCGTITVNNGAGACIQTASSAISGTNGVTLTAGSLSLGGDNTFSGATTLTAGTLTIARDSSDNGSPPVPASGPFGTGTLTINGGTIQPDTSARSIANGVTLGGNHTVAGTQELTFLGTVSMGGAVRTITVTNTSANGAIYANPTTSLTLALGAIVSGSGNFALTKSGPGQMTIQGACQWGGQLLITAGRVLVRGATGKLSKGSGAPPVRIDAGATLELDNATLPIAVTASGGATAVSGRVDDADTVQMNGNFGAFIIRGNGGAAFTETIGTLQLNAGASTVRIAADTSTGANNTTLTCANNFSVLNGSTFNFIRENAAGGAGAQMLNVSAITPADGALLTFATISGPSAQVVNAAVKYQRTPTNVGLMPLVTGIAYSSVASGNWDNASNWTPAGVPAGGDQVTINGAHAISLNGSNRAASVLRFPSNGQLTGTAGNSLTVSSFIICDQNSYNPAISADLTLGGNVEVNQNGQGALTISGAIGETGGARVLSKSGNGVVLISGSNTFSGGSTLNGGTLLLGASSDKPVTRGPLGTGTFSVTGTGAAGYLSTIGASDGNQTIANAISIGADFTFTGSGDLDLSGTAALTASRTMTFANRGVVTFSGVVSGNFTFTKNGPGIVAMNGANTFTAFTLNTGTLRIGNDSNLPTNGPLGTGTFTINATATNFTFIEPTGAARTVNNTLAFNGDFTIGGTQNLTFGGNAPMNAARIINVTNPLTTLNGVVSGGVALTKNGVGTLVLTNNNTFSGATTINAGTLRLNNNTGRLSATSSVTINTGATLDISGGSGSARADSIPDVTVTFNGGTLSMTQPAGALARFDERVGQLNFASSGQIVLTASGTGATGECELRSTQADFNYGTAGRIAFSKNDDPQNGGSAAMVKLAAAANFDVPRASVNGRFAQYDTTLGLIAKSAARYSVADGDWNFPGTWDGGSAPLPTDNVIIQNAVTLSAPLTANSLSFARVDANATTYSLTNSGTLTLTSGAVNINAPESGTIGANLDFGSASGAINHSGGGAFTISGGIPGSTTGGVTVGGPGTLSFSGTLAFSGGLRVAGGICTLSGTNSFAGGTTVSAGKLIVSNNDANLGTGDLTLAGGTLSIANDVALKPARNVVLTAASFVDIPTDLTLEAGGPLTGNFALTKNGAGRVTFFGSSTRNSTTTINAGTIRAGSGGYLGTGGGTLLINNGGTLEIGSGVTLNANPAISANNGATISGFGASNCVPAITPLNGATVTFTHTPVLPSDALTISGTYTLGGAVAQQTIINAGTGRIIFSGGNGAYEGVWFVNSGTLQANSGTALGDNNPTLCNCTVNAGAKLAINGGVTLTTPVILNGGTLGATGGDATITVGGTAVTTNVTPGVKVQAASTISLDDIVSPGQNGRGLSVTSVFSGNADLALAGGDGSKFLILSNAQNTMSGRITVPSLSGLMAQNQTVLGSAANGFTPVTLAGGTLDLRSSGFASSTTINFGNSIDVVAPVPSPLGTTTQSTLNSQNNGANTNNTIALGALSLNAAQLNVTSANNYGLAFASGALGVNATISVSTATINPPPLAFSGPVSGNFALTKAGAGTLLLTGTNSYTGATNVNLGTLQLNGSTGSIASSALNVNAGGTFLIDSSGTNADYNRLPNISTTTVAGGAASIQSPQSVTRTQNFGNLILNAGNNVFTATGNMPTPGTGDAQIIVNTLAANGGAVLNFVRNSTGAPAEFSNFYINDAANFPDGAPILFATVTTAGATAQAIYSRTGSPDGIVPAATSTFIATTAGNWESPSTWQGGVVPPANADVLIRANVTLATSAGVAAPQTCHSISFDTGTLAINNVANAGVQTLAVTSGLIATTGTAVPTINCNVAVGSAAAFVNSTSSGNTIIAGVLSGSGGLIKSGSGFVQLSSANNLTGNLTLAHGTLQLNSDLALGAAGNPLTITGGTIQAGSARTIYQNIIAAGDFTIGGAQQIAFAGTVTLANNDRTLTITNTSNTIFNGVIRDDDEINTPRALFKTGGGTQVHLNAANTFGSPAAGKGLTLNSGTTLTLGNDAALGEGPFAFINGFTPAIQSLNGTRTIANNITAGDNLAITGFSRITLNGAYLMNAAGGNVTRAIDVAGTVPGAALNGVLSGSARPFEKLGTGELELNGNNTFGGGSRLTAGTLTLGGGTALGSPATALTINGAGTRLQSNTAVTLNNTVLMNFDFTFGGANLLTLNGVCTLSAARIVTVNNTALTTINGIINGGSQNFTKTGPGTLVLTAANAYTGTTTITGGTLRLKGDSGSLASSSTVTIGGTDQGALSPTLEIDSSAGSAAQNVNRIPDGADLVFSGGRLIMRAPAGVDRIETVDTISFTNGSSTIELVASGSSSGTCQLIGTGTALTFTNGTLNFIRTSDAAGATANLKMTAGVAAPVPQAMVNGQPAYYDAAQGLIELQNSATPARFTVQDGNWTDPLTWNGQTLPAATDNVIVQNSVTLNAASTCNSLALLRLNAPATVPGLAGAQTLKITSARIYCGADSATIDPGLDFAAVPVEIHHTGAGILTINGTMLCSAGVEKYGAGTLALRADNSTTITGTGVSVLGGTLQIFDDKNLGAANLALIVNGGIASAQSTFTTPTRRLTLGALGGTVDVAANRTWTLAGQLDGNNPFFKIGSGQLTLKVASTRSNSASAYDFIAGGILRTEHTSALNTATPGGFGMQFTNCVWEPGSDCDKQPVFLDNTTVRVAGGSFAINPSGGVTIGIGARVTFAAAGANDVLTLGSANPFVISGGGAGSTITVAGSGRVVANSGTGASTYLGKWIVNGSLRVDTATALSNNNSTVVQINAGGLLANNIGTIANNIVLNGGTIGSTGGDRTYSGIVVVNPGVSSLSLSDPIVAATARSTTFSGLIQGSGDLSIPAPAAPGKLVSFTNAGNSYSGTITVNGTEAVQGVLFAQNGGALGTPASRATVRLNRGVLQLRSDVATNFNANVVVLDDSTIDVNRSAANFGNTLALNNLLIGASTLTTTAGNLYGLRFDGGTTLTGDATLATSASTTLAGSVTGPSDLTKSGNNFLTLLGDSGASFTGELAIDGGAVQLSGGNVRLGASAISIDSGGTLLINGAGANPNRIPDSAAVTLNGGSIVVQSAGGSVSETVGNLIVAKGASTISLSHSGSSTARLTVSGATASQALQHPGGTLQLNRSAGGTSQLSSLLVSPEPANNFAYPFISVAESSPVASGSGVYSAGTGAGIIASASSAGEPVYISAATGYWNVPANWTPAGIPGANDSVIIRAGDTITLNGDRTVDRVTFLPNIPQTGANPGSVTTVGTASSFTAAMLINMTSPVGRVLTMTTGANANQSSLVTAFNPATGLLTMSPALPAAPLVNEYFRLDFAVSANVSADGFTASSLIPVNGVPGRTVTMTSGVASGQSAVIAAFDSANGEVTFASPLGTAPAINDTFILAAQTSGIAGADTLTVASGSVTVNPPANSGGLKGDFYNSTNFTNFAGTRVDPSLAVNAGTGFSPTIGTITTSNNFSVVWTGFIVPNFTDTYYLSFTADDSIRVYVNGRLIADACIGQGGTNYGALMSLVAGTPYPVRIEYHEGTGGVVYQLFWSSASQTGGATQVIPAANLIPASGPIGLPHVNFGSAHARFENLGGGPLTVNGVISGTAAGSVEIGGNGNVVFASANRYAGPTTLTSGLLTLGDSNALSSNDFTVRGGMIAASSSVVIPNRVFASGDFFFDNTINPIIFTNEIRLTDDRIIYFTNTHSLVTFAGPITDGGGGFSFTKGSGGNLLLQSPCTYGGKTIVYGAPVNIPAGTFNRLILGCDDALPTATTLLLQTGYTGGNVPPLIALDLNGFNQTVAGIGLTTGPVTATNPVTPAPANSIVTNTANGMSTFTVNNDDDNFFAGAITQTVTTVTGAVTSGSSVNGFTSATLINLPNSLVTQTITMTNGAAINQVRTIATYNAGTGAITVTPAFSVAPNPADTFTITQGLARITLRKTGSGALALAGANTHIGQTRIEAGSVRAAAVNTLSRNSQIVLSPGALLDLNGNNNDAGGLSITGAAVQTGTGTLTLVNPTNSSAAPGDVFASASGGTPATISGNVVLGANRTFNVASAAPNQPDLVVSAVLSGTGNSLVKSGAGILRLTAAETYTGQTIINRGTLQLAGDTATLATNALIMNSGGTFEITAEGAANPDRILNTTPLTFNGGRFVMNAGSSDRTEQVQTTTFASNSSSIVLSSTGAGNSQLTLTTSSGANNRPVRNGNATFDFVRSQTGTGRANLFFTTGVANDFVPFATVNSNTSVYNGAALTGDGLVDSSGNAKFTIKDGDWGDTSIWNTQSLPATTDDVIIRHAVSIASAQTARSVTFDTDSHAVGTYGITSLTAQTLAVSSGVILTSGTAAPSFDTQVTVGFSSEGIFNTQGTGMTTVRGRITGANGLTKGGPGKLRLLSVTSTYTGGNNISGGVMQLDTGITDAVLGAAANGINLSGGTLALSAGYTSSRTFAAISGAGDGANIGGIDLPAGQELRISTGLAGTGVLGINPLGGGGQVTLNQNAGGTRSGLTVINGGTVRVETSPTALGTGAVTVNSGGTLEIQQLISNSINLNDGSKLRASGLGAAINPITGFLTVAPGARVTIDTVANDILRIGDSVNDLTGGGNGAVITVTGAGRVCANQNSNFLGSWVVNGSASCVLSHSAASAYGSPANSITVTSGLVTPQAATLTIPNPIVLAGGSIGTQSLNGAVYSGRISVTAPSTLMATAGNDATFSGVTSGAPAMALTTAGGGTLVLSNALNSYAGTLDIPVGTLRAVNGGALGGAKQRVSATLRGGQLQLQDNGSASNSTANFNANIVVQTASTIDVNRNGGTNTNNTLFLNNLTLNAALTVTGANGYGLNFPGTTTLQTDAVFAPTSAPLTLSGPVSGNFNLTKNGIGRLTLSGANTYAGPTTISSGILLVNNTSGSGTGAGNVTATTATVGGTGSISGVLTINSGGTISPGVTSGILTVDNNVLLSGAAGFTADLGSATNYDQLHVTGLSHTINLASAALTVNSAFTPPLGTQFMIIRNDTQNAINGTFNNLPEDSKLAVFGRLIEITYRGGDGNDVVLTDAGPIVAGVSYTTAEVMVPESGPPAQVGISLTSIPTGPVTLTFSASDALQGGTLNVISMTFQADASALVPQMLIITPADDQLEDADTPWTITVGITGASAPPYATIDPPDISVLTTNDELREVFVSPTSGLQTTEAGGTAQFTVRLGTVPQQPVTVNLASTRPDKGTPNKTSLTFNPNLSALQPQTVTINPVDNQVHDGLVPYTITTTVVTADPVYQNAPAPDVSVTSVDNDVANITVSAGANLQTTEAGGIATFSVKLDTIPAQIVTLNIDTDDHSEGTVSPVTLTFAADATALDFQIVTITGVDDAISDESITYHVTFANSVSADPDYSGRTLPDISVVNLDDEPGTVTITPRVGLQTTEAGGDARFTVKLDSIPIAAVTIALASSNANEGTVAPAQLVFQPDGTALTPQEVIVTGVNDDIDDGDAVFTIDFTFASADIRYDQLAVPGVQITNVDDDSAGILVSPISGPTSEDGGTATFTISLKTRPTAQVTITLASSDESEGTVEPSVIFPAGETGPKTVTVTGVNDFVLDGNAAYKVTSGPAQSSDAKYAGLTGADADAINNDNDTIGIVVDPSTIETTESGGSVNFEIRLNVQPTAPVTITLSSGNTNKGTVTPSVTFAPGAKLQQPVQVVTVTPLNDDIDDGDVTYSITTTMDSSSAPEYASIDPDDVTVFARNDDIAGAIVSPPVLQTIEGGNPVSFSMTLKSRPLGNVNIALTATDTTEGSLSANSLQFTTQNWNVAQSISVTPINDGIVDGDITYGIFTTATSADAKYNGAPIPDVLVTNLHLDNPPVFTSAITFAPLNPAVGQTVRFTVAAADPEGKPLVISYDYGDGVSDTAGQHIFAAAQTYTVTVSVSDGTNTATSAVLVPILSRDSPDADIDEDTIVNRTDSDDDGDGFPDELEQALGNSPYDKTDTPFGGAGSGTPNPLIVSKLSIALNFAKPASDGLQLSGGAGIGSGFVVAQQQVVMYIGGVVKIFTLDAKGASAKSSTEAFKLSVKSVKGTVLPQTAKFAMKISKSNLADKFADEGLINEDIKNYRTNVRVIMLMDHKLYQKDQPQTYSAKKGKTGKTK